MMETTTNIRGIYRHFKGKYYEVIDVGRHSETLEEFVIYRHLYGDFGFFIRPKNMFFEEVERDGQKMPRFALVKELVQVEPYKLTAEDLDSGR